jgi:CMP-N-acetylneuraminic acid synthetase
MLTVFLPCRAGSQRVPRKNTRPFAGEADGLLGIKLRQLIACAGVDRVLVSTNDPEVRDIALRYVERSDGRLALDDRPDELCSSATSTDEVIRYVPSVIDTGDVLWTHVTSPFYDERDYEAAIDAYRTVLAAGEHDSLMGVTALRSFIWDEHGPLNYDRDVEKWPRTQTLTPLYEVNSAIFLAPVAVYRELGDRIGRRPALHVIPSDRTVDIDWQEDFAFAAQLWRNRGADR